jgi:hypothetical protein
MGSSSLPIRRLLRQRNRVSPLLSFLVWFDNAIGKQVGKYWTLAKDNLAKTVDQAKTSRLAAIEG